MAARSIWNGTIAFGLMSVPVKLHTATESKTVHFREVHLDDGAKIEHRRFCSKEDKEVPYKQIVKGYEVAEDTYVVLEKDEVAAAAGDGAHRIEVEHFVDAGAIDPVFFDKTYYLGAGKDGAQPYRVLLDALEQTGRAGIGRFTFHDREYLTAIRARDGVLVLHTLRFADELVPGKDVDVAAPSRGQGQPRRCQEGRPLMARSLWTGSISFGLVNVPVALYSAVRDLDVHFRQLHGKDGAPIDTRRFCSEEDKEVPFEAVGHGYQLDDGEQVVLTDEDLAAAAPRKTRTIDIEAFVDVDEVDPMYFDHPYFLAPVGEAEGNLRAYQLLVRVMASTDRAALGRMVLRSKEYLVLVRVRDERLALTTMLFHDEVRPTKDVDTGGRKPPKAQLQAAKRLVEALSTEWDPTEYHDRYRERLLDVIERKRKGKRITAPKGGGDRGGQPRDIMAALSVSLERA